MSLTEAIACLCVKQFVMSLPAMSLGDWFSVSKKGGTEGGGLVYTQVENSMAVHGFGHKNPSVGSLHNWCWKTVISPPCSVQV